MAEVPKVNDRRLQLLSKQLNRVRKSITIENDKLKEHCDRIAKAVERAKASEKHQAGKKAGNVKASLAEKRSLQHCLRRRRESTSLENETKLMYGTYEGVPIDSLKPEVNHITTERQPHRRRERKVERMKTEGRMDGRLVDYNTTMKKFNDVLRRPSFAPRRERHLEDNVMTLPRVTCPTASFPAQGRPPASRQGLGTRDSCRAIHLPPITAGRQTMSREQSRIGRVDSFVY